MLTDVDVAGGEDEGRCGRVHFPPSILYIYIFLDVVAVRIDVVVSLLASKLFFSQLATPPMLINASAPAIEFEG
jgi:hypothetical protein